MFLAKLKKSAKAFKVFAVCDILKLLKINSINNSGLLWKLLPIKTARNAIESEFISKDENVSQSALEENQML